MGLVLWLVLGGSAAPSPSLAAELSRLEGQRVSVGADGYVIEDIAGEGRPWVGVVVAEGTQLWLDTGETRLQLTGPLAQPRIAGPAYKVWVIGDRRGSRLEARRLGVLAPPAHRP